MKQFGLVALGLVVLVVIVLGGGFISLVSADEGRNEAWGNVESTSQRRADLIPNLVSTVKAYAAHEEKVFAEVTEARAKLGEITVNIGAEGPSAEQLQQLAAAQKGMSGALSRLMAVAESYPELKASQNFLAHQDQLEGTENRINVARERYNAAVRRYNTRARIFFFFGFETAQAFEAAAGSETAPKVDFGA